MTKVTAGLLPWRRRRDERPARAPAGCAALLQRRRPGGRRRALPARAGPHLVVWDHGSTDETPDVLRRLPAELVELQTIPRSVDFYGLYQAMSAHLLKATWPSYDWVSWPDQDEFLEGPDRSRPYREWLEEVAASPYDWIQFNNFNFWWTEADDPTVPRAVERVRHYSLFADCGPRIRSWRASSTNIRQFNHNPPLGERYPRLFNLRHYPMRSEAQMARRLQVDRAGLRRGGANYHYDNMSSWPDRLVIPPEKLALRRRRRARPVGHLRLAFDLRQRKFPCLTSPTDDPVRQARTAPAAATGQGGPELAGLAGGWSKGWPGSGGDELSGDGPRAGGLTRGTPFMPASTRPGRSGWPWGSCATSSGGRLLFSRLGRTGSSTAFTPFTASPLFSVSCTPLAVIWGLAALVVSALRPSWGLLRRRRGGVGRARHRGQQDRLFGRGRRHRPGPGAGGAGGGATTLDQLAGLDQRVAWSGGPPRRCWPGSN